MLRGRPYLLLGLAGVFGLGAALLATSWLENRVAGSDGPLHTRPVVVATRAIPFGERIGEADLKLADWPADSVPAGAFDSIAEVSGRFANQKLVAGEALLQERVTDAASGSSLSMQIEANKRAMSVRVNDVIGVGGFLLPGNRVDVLATRMTQDRRAVTRTLLQNLKVLAVDQTAQADKDKPVVVRAVTLEMDPAEAEQLVGATEEGTVQLALRNPDDADMVTAQPAEAAPAAAAPPPQLRRASSARPRTPPPAPTITIIRQAQVSVTEINP